MRYWHFYYEVILEVVSACKSCNLQSLPASLQRFQDCNLQYLSCGLYNVIESRSNDTTDAVSQTFENLGYIIEAVSSHNSLNFWI